MTRLERLQAQAARDAKKLAETQDRVMLEEAKKLEREREANNKRRYRHGARLDDKGFFALKDEALDALVDLLVPLLTLPDPVDTLNRLIGVPGVLAAKGVKVVAEKVESNGATVSAEKR
jgi:hypothetical protein